MNWFASIILWGAILASLYFVTFWFLVFVGGEQEARQPRLRSKPLVSVVIPAFNEQKRIAKTMRSVLRLNYPSNKIELLVVNDGSIDRTADVVKNIKRQYRGRNIRLVNKANGGKGTALNVGLKKAKGEFFVCMDADSKVEKDALLKMLPHFSKKNVGVVLPLMKVDKPKKLIQKMQWYEYLVNMFYKKLMSNLDCVHVSPGPFSVYRKSVVEKVGGFDENNMTEDLEMTLRLQSKHYKIVQLLDTEVHTDSPKDLKGFHKQRNRWNKGALLNAFKYRKMLFNRKYGDFGVFMLPTVVLTGLVALVLVSNLVYHLFRPVVEFVRHLSFVNFDIMTILRGMEFNFSFLDFNFRTIITVLFVLTLSITILKVAHMKTRERVMKYGVFSLVIYLFTYYILLGMVWARVLLDLSIGRKQKW